MQLSTITSLLAGMVLLTSLPQTGNSALTWLLWIGGALVAIAIILMLVRRRNKPGADE